MVSVFRYFNYFCLSLNKLLMYMHMHCVVQCRIDSIHCNCELHY